MKRTVSDMIEGIQNGKSRLRKRTESRYRFHLRMNSELRQLKPDSEQDEHMIASLLNHNDRDVRDAGAIWIAVRQINAEFTIPRLLDLMVEEIRNREESLDYHNVYAAALTEVGGPAHDLLRGFWKDGNEDTRNTIVDALCGMSKDRLIRNGYLPMIPDLIDFTLNSSKLERVDPSDWNSGGKVSIELLIKFGSEAKDQIENSIQTSNSLGRLALAEALIQIDRYNVVATDTVFQIMRAQDSPASVDRALKCLLWVDEQLIDTNKAEAIAERLSDESATIRRHAMLEMLSFIRLKPLLARAIENPLRELMRKNDAWCSADAMLALVLGGFVDDEIIEHLVKSINSGDVFQFMVSVQAAEIIGPRAAGALPALRKALAEDNPDLDDYQDVLDAVRSITLERKND